MPAISAYLLFSGTCQCNPMQKKTCTIYINDLLKLELNTCKHFSHLSASFTSMTWIASLSSLELPFYFAPKIVANVVPSCLIGKVSNVGQPTREHSAPHVFSTRINKRNISTICWHAQLLLEEIKERFAIPFVCLRINVVEAILYTHKI